MGIGLDQAKIARLSQAVPRYTSYPTAPHFHAGIDGATYRAWLADLPAGTRLSLYLHIPFCDTLCWFCGCHTQMIKRYDPVTRYLASLEREIATIGALVPAGVSVTHIHWGGGSPSMLAPADIAGLARALRRAFTLAAGCDFAVEIDPRGMDDARLDALAAAGLTRASIGVQDFDADVQRAINRFQSVEETRAVVEGLRRRGVASLNIDMLYGLPHQSPEAMMASLETVLSFRPDRLALFGYAHVPWMKKHQEMIDPAALPDMATRVDSVERATARLLEAGYTMIGIDHFARPGDSLAKAAANGALRRNFQGYTSDESDALIGLGASAIGHLPQGLIQNETGGQAYQRRLAVDGLATARGVAFTDDDRARADAIEDLMCNLRFDGARLASRHGALAEALIAEAEALMVEENPDWFTRRPGGFALTPEGRPFLRLLAARFDAYLPRALARHSTAL